MLLSGNLTNSNLAEKLRCAVNWDKDLPEYVFWPQPYKFFLFERSIIDSNDLLVNLFSSNVKSYSADSFISFGIPGSQGYAQFFFDEIDPELRAAILQKGFRDFFGGAVGYPVLLTNTNIDWIAFESAYEELGILAVRSDGEHADEFISLLEADGFISCERMKIDTPGFSHLAEIYGELINVIHRNYGCGLT